MTPSDPRPAYAPEPRPVPSPPPAQRARRRWPWLLGLAIVAFAAYRMLSPSAPQGPAPGAPGKPGGQAVPVVAAPSRRGDLPVYLTGLGSVTGFNTVTVRSRVDGQITKVAFQEGQHVKEGDLLVEIDPRPFQVQLEQAEGQLARDAAQLQDAQRTTARYRDLLKQGVVAQQDFDDQSARVGQFEGAIKTDQATIDNAKLQLEYSRVTAPISGRVGLRRVDVGNLVHATDQTGLVVITQLQPIAVLFTVPEDNLPPIMDKLARGEKPVVEAYDRAGRQLIATGSLLTADNQIDPSTGTTRLKAIFDNESDRLFPNQFVNARLLLDVKKDAVIVPLTAVQRGPQGTFVYVVKPDQTVEVRSVTVGTTTGTEASIDTGLAENELVVVDGVDKLRAGVAVQVKMLGEQTQSEAAKPKS